MSNFRIMVTVSIREDGRLWDGRTLTIGRATAMEAMQVWLSEFPAFLERVLALHGSREGVTFEPSDEDGEEPDADA